MTLHDILNINRYPFNKDIISDDINAASILDFKKKKFIRFLLMIQYYKILFRKLQIDIELPNMTIMINKRFVSANYNIETYSEEKTRVNLGLFHDVITKCGWKSTILHKKAKEIIGDTANENEWLKMLQCMPELVDNVANNLYRNSEIVLMWSNQLAEYLNVSREYTTNDSSLKKCEETIGVILQEICDPLQCRGRNYHKLMPDRYIIGFCTGDSNDCHASFDNLHPHFAVNIIVLKYLIDFFYMVKEV